uniref:uncharacterized protein LOC132680456 n=1 Tax=Panthera onca TaxID=9690 RepID=UPI002954F6D1|nr:uncharacterized protein LOC132680456 [Panthera onca]
MPGPGSAQRWAAAAGRWSCRLLALLLLVPGPGGASEITFELPDNAKQCFYEDITQGTKCTLEFQVITGGHYDVDCRLEDPDGNVLYKEMKKQYDSFTFTASKNGTYKFCFSNEFSTFTHKTVYFDFQVGEDPPLFPSENRVSALTQMESACVSIHEALKSVIDYQTHFRLREAQGRSRAEDLNTRVAYWSVGEALILLVVSIGQVFLLKSFFSDKRTTTTRVGSGLLLSGRRGGSGCAPHPSTQVCTEQTQRRHPHLNLQARASGDITKQRRERARTSIPAPLGREAGAPDTDTSPSRRLAGTVGVGSRGAEPARLAGHPPSAASGAGGRGHARGGACAPGRTPSSLRRVGKSPPAGSPRGRGRLGSRGAPRGSPPPSRRVAGVRAGAASGRRASLGLAGAAPSLRVSWGSTIQNAGLVIEEAAGTEDLYAYLPRTHIRHFALFTVLLFNVEDPFGTLFCWVRGSPPLLTWMLIMGVGKSKIDPCPLSLPWGKSPSVDMSQRPHEADSKKSNDISLRDIAEHSHSALTPSGEREGTEATEEVPEEDEEEVFLKFVILHAEDDTDEALRVQNLLQNDFGIKPGIIFAEMPCGRQHLQNLDDAVNGSAWTILLLTENFLRDTWCKFQFYTSLMNSVNRQHKYNSVIPLRPLNNPLPRERTPFALRTINALEEESRGFPTQVERIFQESVYKIQQSIWKETRTTLQRQSIA